LAGGGKGNVDNNTKAIIAGAQDGVDLDGTGSYQLVYNFGSIIGSGGSGVYFGPQTHGQLLVENGNYIFGATYGIWINSDRDGGTISNYAGATIRCDSMHAFADSVTGRGADDAYHGFLDLLRDWLARRVRLEPEPPGGGATPAAAAALPLARLAEVWEKVEHSAADAEEYKPPELR